MIRWVLAFTDGEWIISPLARAGPCRRGSIDQYFSELSQRRATLEKGWIMKAIYNSHERRDRIGRPVLNNLCPDCRVKGPVASVQETSWIQRMRPNR
jgi:hypothetical protein